MLTVYINKECGTQVVFAQYSNGIYYGINIHASGLPCEFFVEDIPEFHVMLDEITIKGIVFNKVKN